MTDIGTHRLQVRVHHVKSGLLVHKFGPLFTYYAYLELDAVYPLFGSEYGGTPLMVSVTNLLTDPALYESPLKCRFRLDFSPEVDESLQTDAQILSSSLVTCPTPDFSADALFPDEPMVDYIDTFVSISEIDGQFRVDKQQRFMLTKHMAVISVTPNTGWDIQEQLVTIKLTNVLPEPTLRVKLRTYET